MKILWRAALSALLVAMAVGAPAQAAPSPQNVYNKVAAASDPDAAMQKLTSAERKALNKYLTVTEVKVAPQAPQAVALAITPNGCQDGFFVVGAYNFLGHLMWTWEHIVEWCYTSDRLTYTYQRAYGVTHAIGWSWRTEDKHKSVNTVANPDTLTAFAQAEFKLCAFAEFGCIQYKYPWSSVRVWGSNQMNQRWAWSQG